MMITAASPAPARACDAPLNQPQDVVRDVSTGRPLQFEVAYTSEILSNVAGGVRHGTRYLDNLDLVATADLDSMLSWSGASAHVYGIYNNGQMFSDLVGDAHIVSNIEAGVKSVRLYEAWVQQKFAHGSLRIGLYDVNTEFDVLESASMFVNGAHGMGTDIGQSGERGPSIFPFTALAARLELTPGDEWGVRVAVADGAPGDPDHPRRTAIKLSGKDGALMIAEVEAPLSRGKVLIGGWRYTARFDAFDGARARGNGGLYLRGETRLTSESGDAEQGLAAFGRLGVANGRFNMFHRFASAGLVYTGPFAGRGKDQAGVAIAAGFAPRRYREIEGAERHEIAFEISYRAHMTPWLSVQPNIHYIVNPGLNPAIGNAWVVGLRTRIGFSGEL